MTMLEELMTSANEEVVYNLTKRKNVVILAREIGRRLKAARENERLTQEEIATALGIGRAAYANIETGRSLLTVEHLIKLPKILKQPVTYFLGIEIDMDEDEARLLAAFRALPKEGPARSFAYRAVWSMTRALEDDERDQE